MKPQTRLGTLLNEVYKRIDSYIQESPTRIVPTKQIKAYLIEMFGYHLPTFNLALKRLLEDGVLFRLRRGLYIHRRSITEEDIPDILLTHEKLYGERGLARQCELVYEATSYRFLKRIRESADEYVSARMEVLNLYQPRLLREQEISLWHKIRRLTAEQSELIESARLEEGLLDRLLQIVERIPEVVRKIKAIHGDLRESEAFYNRFRSKFLFDASVIPKDELLRYVSEGEALKMETERSKFIQNLFFMPSIIIERRTRIFFDTNTLIALLLNNEIERSGALQAIGSACELWITDKIKKEFQRTALKYPEKNKQLMRSFNELEQSKALNMSWNYSQHDFIGSLGLDSGEESLLQLFTDFTSKADNFSHIFVTDEIEKGSTISQYVQDQGGRFLWGAISFTNQLVTSCFMDIETSERALSQLAKQVYPETYIDRLPQKRASLKLAWKKKKSLMHV